jgi:hypothetical protein
VNESPAPQRDTDAPEIDPAIVERVRKLYGHVLTDDEIRQFAAFEQERPNWHCWPHVGWAAGTHIIYARRGFSATSVIVAETMAELADAVDDYIADLSSRWMP